MQLSEKTVLGKSTLSKLIAGLLIPKKGKIFVDDIDVSDKKKFIDLRRKVGIVFQNPENQIIFNNVYDDLAFAIRNLNLHDEKTRIENGLEKVKMQEYMDKPAYELSLGQKQRITIAGVLAINPDYLILDEPTTMIDSEGKQDIYNILQKLKGEKTIIYITNAIDEILMADRIVVIESGKIIGDFRKEEILENAQFLKQHNFKIPKIVESLIELQKNDINLTLENWTEQELTSKIIEVLKNEKYS